MTSLVTPTAAGTVDFSAFRLALKQEQLVDLFNEWYGKDRYEDEHGGISGRDKKFGSAWRKHLSAQHHSRTRRTVEAVEAFAKEKQILPMEACIALQPAYEAVKCSVGNFVKNCQENGLLKKKGQRGKQKKK